jgi:hypothetical protein
VLPPEVAAAEIPAAPSSTPRSAAPVAMTFLVVVSCISRTLLLHRIDHR